MDVYEVLGYYSDWVYRKVFNVTAFVIFPIVSVGLHPTLVGRNQVDCSSTVRRKSTVLWQYGCLNVLKSSAWYTGMNSELLGQWGAPGQLKYYYR